MATIGKANPHGDILDQMINLLQSMKRHGCKAYLNSFSIIHESPMMDFGVPGMMKRVPSGPEITSIEMQLLVTGSFEFKGFGAPEEIEERKRIGTQPEIELFDET